MNELGLGLRGATLNVPHPCRAVCVGFPCVTVADSIADTHALASAEHGEYRLLLTVVGACSRLASDLMTCTEARKTEKPVDQ
jgi:hypothetical protein